MGGNLTIFDKDHDTTEEADCKSSCSQTYGFATITMYVQLVATKRDWMRVPNLKFRNTRQKELVVHKAETHDKRFPHCNFSVHERLSGRQLGCSA